MALQLQTSAKDYICLLLKHLFAGHKHILNGACRDAFASKTRSFEPKYNSRKGGEPTKVFLYTYLKKLAKIFGHADSIT
jgi:hypothetical protein